MKAYLLQLPVLVAALFIGNKLSAQAGLAPDQNPNFEVSRAKYMGMADSVNEWHSTTVQDTYRAKDFMADRAEARMERRQYRRELRRYRASWYQPYNNSYYNNYNNYGYYNGYRSRYYRNNYYRGHRNFWLSPWWW